MTADNNNFYDCHIKTEELASYINVPIATDSSVTIKSGDSASMMVSGGSLVLHYNASNCTDGARKVDLPYEEGIVTRCRYVVAIMSS